MEGVANYRVRWREADPSGVELSNRRKRSSEEGMVNLENKSKWLFPFFWMAAFFMLFLPYASHYFYLFDDFAQLDYVAHHSFREIFVTSQHRNYRPIAFLFWKACLEIFGIGNPSAFSVLNLSFHSLNSVLLGFVLRKFKATPLIAWSAAAFFLVFPSINEALFWMSGGHDVFGMTLILGTLLCASLGLNQKHKNRLKLILMALLVFLGTLGAMLSKETAYVLFPLVASLGVLNAPHLRSIRWQVWLAWAVSIHVAIGVFFLLRIQIIPLSESAYGDPRLFFVNAPLFKNFIKNFFALFVVGYLGKSAWIGGVCKISGILSGMTFLSSFFDRAKRYGVVGLACALGLALVSTLFCEIERGSAIGGRLLYISALIVSIMMSIGLAYLLHLVQLAKSAKKVLKAAVFSSLFIVLCLNGISLSSFSQRYSEGSAIVQNVIQQVTRSRQSPYIYIRNLPHALTGGPNLMKCYALGLYFQIVGGEIPRFRCDQVVLDPTGERYSPISPPLPDEFSSYSKEQTGERELELSF